MAGAEAEAKKNNWPVVITIVDSGGNLVMLSRLDNAQWGSIEVAKDKARSAVAFRRPTKVFQDLIAQGGATSGCGTFPAPACSGAFRSSSTARSAAPSASPAYIAAGRPIGRPARHLK